MFDFIGTASGKSFHFLNPQEDEICISDISNALSNLCRYSGHVNKFYSVAEHSCILADIVFMETGSKEQALSALLHDASEAYLVDVPRPIKPYLVGYEEMEHKVQSVILKKFNAKPMNDFIKFLDCNIVRNEAEVLFDIIPDWVVHYQKLQNINIICLSPIEAKELFLNRYNLYK